MMTARDGEAALLDRCALAARGIVAEARDQREANVFWLAASSLQTGFREEAQHLQAASDSYFSRHSNERLPASKIVQRGWVMDLPRLRDTLACKLKWA